MNADEFQNSHWNHADGNENNKVSKISLFTHKP